jgi:hypothetical protein
MMELRRQFRCHHAVKVEDIEQHGSRLDTKLLINQWTVQLFCVRRLKLEKNARFGLSRPFHNKPLVNEDLEQAGFHICFMVPLDRCLDRKISQAVSSLFAWHSSNLFNEHRNKLSCLL